MNQLYGLVADILGVDPTGISAETGPLTLAKWDSLNHMRLVAAVEETYGVQFTTEEIVSVINVKGFATVLQNKGVSVS